MKIQKWSLLISLAIALSPTTVTAQFSTGAQAQHVVTDARAEGMGRAFTAVADGASAIWWNPGALALQPHMAFQVSGMRLVPDLADDVRLYGVSGVVPIDERFGVGGHISYLDYGESIATDEQGNERGTFDSWESMVLLGAGYDIAPILLPPDENHDFHLGVGGDVKICHVDLAPKEFTLDGQSATGTAFDIDLGALATMRMPVDSGSRGSQAFPDYLGFRMGMSLRNALNRKIRFNNEDQADPLGMFDRWGIAVEGAMGGSSDYGYFFRGVLGAEVNGVAFKVYDDEESILNYGGEVVLGGVLSLRGGYINDVDGGIRDFTFGAGVGVDPSMPALEDFPLGGRLDISRNPQADGLDHVWKISLTGMIKF